MRQLRAKCRRLRINGCRAMLLALSAIIVSVPAAAADFAIILDEDAKQAEASLRECLAGQGPKPKIESYQTLEQAVAADSEVLVIVMPRQRVEYSADLLEELKQRKVIGIGYGAAQLFGQMELEIKGGACAHGAITDLSVQQSVLLAGQWEPKQIAAYDEQARGDQFGMYIPKLSELVAHVDVVARRADRENYAPIVRQSNFVLIGLSYHADAWSDDLRKLVHDIATELRAAEAQPFRKPTRPLLAPGQHPFRLGKSRSTEELFSKTFYLKFNRPTLFTATLQHADSQNMMMLFMGEKERLHWTREDARAGEPLRVAIEISEQDLERIGDNYWTLSITNFDRDNPAACVLNVEYDAGQ